MPSPLEAGKHPIPSSPRSPASHSLAVALRRVLVERDRARRDLAAKPVHDLRVALRRARSLAEGFSELDPHRGWRHLRKACKQLQKCLADLRDVQVMLQWVRRLHFLELPGKPALVEALHGEELRARRKARAALEDFPRRRWKHWRRRLPRRAAALPFDDLRFDAAALRRLKDVLDLDRRRRRSDSRVAYHRLRVAVKRFRYTVESFLPSQDAAWRPTLKRLQKWLGEIHDLDVLRARMVRFARENRVPRSMRARQWAVIESARKDRVVRCEKLISPKPPRQRRERPTAPLWERWRRELDMLLGISFPDGEESSRSVPRLASPLAAKRIPRSGRRLPLS